jgi:hypothetical protein
VSFLVQFNINFVYNLFNILITFCCIAEYFRELIFKTRDYTNIQIKSQVFVSVFQTCQVKIKKKLFTLELNKFIIFQRLYYVGLGVEPRKASLGDYYYLTPEDLPHIINSIEGYLGT